MIAAAVWNFGAQAPLAQQTWQTGLMVQGDGDAEAIVNTSPAWVATTNAAYTALPIDFAMVRGYWAAGPGERVDGATYPWGWERADFDASGWRPAVGGPPARPREARDAASRHMLVPRDIPMMEERVDRLPRVRRSDLPDLPPGFPATPANVTVTARGRVRFLFDRAELTTAYPGNRGLGRPGRDHRRCATPRRSSWGRRATHKGHRDEIDGKVFAGYGDQFLPDGGARRVFRPLWWRTFRYLEVTIETAADASRPPRHPVGVHGVSVRADGRASRLAGPTSRR